MYLSCNNKVMDPFSNTIRELSLKEMEDMFAYYDCFVESLYLQMRADNIYCRIMAKQTNINTTSGI